MLRFLQEYNPNFSYFIKLLFSLCLIVIFNMDKKLDLEYWSKMNFFLKLNARPLCLFLFLLIVRSIYMLK